MQDYAISSKRILIIMSDTGGGHRSAAQAIAAALNQFHPGFVRVDLLDFFARCTPWPINQAGPVYGSLINHAPWAWAALYNATNSRRRIETILRTAIPFVSHCMVNCLQADPPDVMVSVHPLANHLAVAVANRLAGLGSARSRPQVLTVVTDLETTHSSWFCANVDWCLVPTRTASERGLNFGMPPDRLQVIGLPVDPRFEPQETGERTPIYVANIRTRLGINPERFTVLLVGGGEGMAKIYKLARAVAEAKLPVQLVVVAGRNLRLRQRLEQTVWEIPTSIHGFVNNMPDWMHAADVIVTKAGPSTISEALLVGLPILLYGFVPGQEAGNVHLVVENGAGLLTDTPEKLVAALRELTGPGAWRLREMGKRARELSRPAAATEIARRILEAEPRESCNRRTGSV
jgi:1,2-diacylglycerol 3-beta-galactosyltransferase